MRTKYSVLVYFKLSHKFNKVIAIAIVVRTDDNCTDYYLQ